MGGEQRKEFEKKEKIISEKIKNKVTQQFSETNSAFWKKS